MKALRPPNCGAAARNLAPGGGDGFGDVVLQCSWAHVASVLQRWVAKQARPVSLRQLMFFGRSLTEPRLLSSANYVRTELPTRLSHRIRDMQLLPYMVVSNPHIADVYNMYWNAFDTFRKVKEIKTLEDNDNFCKIISQMLKSHLTVIPKLAMGVLESSALMDQDELNKFMNRILQSRISRRVIAEQHLALTDGFSKKHRHHYHHLHHHDHYHNSSSASCSLVDPDFVGNVLVKCVAKDVVERCGAAVKELARSAHGPDVALPEIQIEGDLGASFPFILSHLEYIIGELLRNSVDAVVERTTTAAAKNQTRQLPPPPIEVTICESTQHVIVRVSDQGGGIPRDMLPYLWSFSKGPHSERLLGNLGKVPKLSATLQEVRVEADYNYHRPELQGGTTKSSSSSLSSLSSRPPNLRLGIGLPLSRVYAEYWAGSLELHSLEGYGVDVFLQISKLGNKNEQLTTRASMDAV
ncbi:pyruvate dehydrogenase kinase [Magnaporthiopsis poae ATCC 64411]|uniref:Protein-serine/threonine kinase n=1 Tax=Magnaporthiopsis poae (strain ATCC 64411 / 73-15) TaxID=644358 RepID=A0A0C4E8V8_MAGP6|nr:pyruvate dehydrogenase kinase [Magnaporthiopsis poae ATCC 64411]